jgi:antitoxin component of MazEF toxin-antitoxin module
MDPIIEKTTVRRVGDSLYFRIPLSYWRAHNLKPGDAFFWFPREESVILKRITPQIVSDLVGKEEPVAGA